MGVTKSSTIMDTCLGYGKGYLMHNWDSHEFYTFHLCLNNNMVKMFFLYQGSSYPSICCVHSNCAAGKLFGIPLRGTHSHAFVSSFMVGAIYNHFVSFSEIFSVLMNYNLFHGFKTVALIFNSVVKVVRYVPSS